MNVLENDTAELQQEGKGRQPAVPSSEEGCYPSEEQEDKEAAKAVAVPAMRLSPGPQTTSRRQNQCRTNAGGQIPDLRQGSP